jgi:mannose-6-phosphate isomerase
VTLGEKEVPLTNGESLDIPKGKPHRIENRGSVDLTFIEVQTGEYFGEDDVERIEDDYGRI